VKKYGIKRILIAGLAAASLCMGSVHAEPVAQQIPSPLVAYTSVRDAWAVAGLPVYTPTLLPVGYAQKDIIVIDRSLAEIFYRNEAGKEILFRMAKGDADISGDNTVYEVNQVVQVGRQYIRVKGTEKRVSLALWSRGGYTFSLSFEEPVSIEAVQAIVSTVPWN
jgi:hypothetical protein